MIESAGAPGSQTSLREANSARILEAVKLYGQITQVELATVTRLSPATVSNIVRQLTLGGVLQTSATTRSGRRAQLVQLARSAVAVGVHVGFRNLEIKLADTSLGEVAKQHLRLPPDHRYDTTLGRVALLITEMAESVGLSMPEVVGVGVTMPASHRRQTGPPVALAAWHDADVADELERRLRLPVIVRREADAAAVGEARLGALRGAGLGLYVRVGETTDSSVLLGGNLMGGSGEVAAGLGHVRVDPAGRICVCGARGCLNTVVSAQALRELLRLSHGPVTLRELATAAKEGDRGCEQVVADAGRVIGAAVADFATALGPDRIVVGGPLMAAGDVLFNPIREALRSRPLLPDPYSVALAAEMPDSAEALGMAALVHDTTSLTPVKEG